MYIACVTVTAIFRERKDEYEYVGERKSDTLCADSGIGTQCSYRGRCAGSRQILDIESPGSPAIPLLHKCPRELKANTKKDVRTPAFTAASVTAAKTEKQYSVYRHMDVSKNAHGSLLRCIKKGTFKFFYIYLFCMCMCMHMCTHTCSMTHTWKSGDNLPESVLPFHHEYPEHQTQAVRLIGTNLDSLSILVIPEKEVLARTMGDMNLEGVRLSR